MRVADEFGVTCAQSYDDLAREEWARRVSIGDPTFSIDVESQRTCKNSLRIAKRRHNIKDDKQDAASSNEEKKNRNVGKPKSKPQPAKLFCRFCKRDHDESQCWNKLAKRKGK